MSFNHSLPMCCREAKAVWTVPAADVGVLQDKLEALSGSPAEQVQRTRRSVRACVCTRTCMHACLSAQWLKL